MALYIRRSHFVLKKEGNADMLLLEAALCSVGKHGRGAQRDAVGAQLDVLEAALDGKLERRGLFDRLGAAVFGETAEPEPEWALQSCCMGGHYAVAGTALSQDAETLGSAADCETYKRANTDDHRCTFDDEEYGLDHPNCVESCDSLLFTCVAPCTPAPAPWSFTHSCLRARRATLPTCPCAALHCRLETRIPTNLVGLEIPYGCKQSETCTIALRCKEGPPRGMDPAINSRRCVGEKHFPLPGSSSTQKEDWKSPACLEGHEDVMDDMKEQAAAKKKK